MNAIRFICRLLWMQGRVFRRRILDVRSQSKLLLLVLFSFIFGYLVVGYFLFYYGLKYLEEFPVIGPLLSQRILFLVFGFFFLMLVFSNLITGYSVFFKNRETEWLLTLPVRHRHVFLWKFLEALVVSSWALIFLSAPLMAAYGRAHGVPPGFYVQVILIYFPFVVVPALLGAWLLLALVRFLSHGWTKKLLLVAAAVAVLVLIFGVRPVGEEEAAAFQGVASFDRLLRHTRLTLNPYLPSAWVAQAVLAWREGFMQTGGFYFLLLLSNALFGLVLSYEVAGRAFYGVWADVQTRRAHALSRGDGAGRRRMSPASVLEWFASKLSVLDRSIRALMVKDARVFWRDPAQWTQFAIFFGLLCIYFLNLRNISFNFRSPFWTTVISYLNLTASSLTLSTLTTRFAFPQFSLEGRRFWILGLAPIGLPRIVMQKFWSSCVPSMGITVGLMLLSSIMLKLGAGQVVFFVATVALMSASLCGLAVGLGVIYPNVREDNPSKIVSGFGGTLCLVVSFIYIIGMISLLSVPAMLPFFQTGLGGGTVAAVRLICSAIALAGSALLLFVPMRMAVRTVKTLEF